MSLSLSIFSIPKAFAGHIGLIQENAIATWKAQPGVREIILFGDDPGVEEAAERMGVRHVAAVARNHFGTPLLSYVFERAAELSQSEVLCYANADIIFLDDLAGAVRRLSLPRFLMTGRRWNLDILSRLDLDRPDWTARLWQAARERGDLHPPSGMDYFIFPRAFTPRMPPFAIGRTAWDNWMIWDARQRNVPVVDATRCLRVVHQNHDYSHYMGGLNPTKMGGPEADENRRLAGSCEDFTVMAATHELTSRGARRALSPAYWPTKARVLSVLYPALQPLRRTAKRVKRLASRASASKVP